MHRVLAMMSCALAVTMTVGVGAATALMAPSTGHIASDWDVGTSGDDAMSSAAHSLGEEFFHVEWTARVDTHGRSRVSGRVYDDYGEAATGVRLEIVALDSAGNELGRVTAPVQGTVPADSKAWFDAPAPAGSSYRVRVVSFEFAGPGPGK